MNEEEELTQVLTEFHQRNQRERVLPSGKPEPFEITSSVVTLGKLSPLEPLPLERPANADQQTLFSGFEKNFYFGQNRYLRFRPVPDPPTYIFILDLQIQCFDENAPTKPMIVNVLLSKWERPQAFLEGPVFPAFFFSPYLPAQTDEAPRIVNCEWTIGPPVPTASPFGIKLQVALQYPDSGDFAETYYLFGEHQEFWTVHNEGSPPYIETNFSAF